MGGPGSGRKKGSTNKSGKKSNVLQFPKSKKQQLEEMYARKKAAGKLSKQFVRYD